jgi:hypothetical protein
MAQTGQSQLRVVYTYDFEVQFYIAILKSVSVPWLLKTQRT